jgi:predicted DCC family thiol-disulfide oxidoreductase YuxK
MNQAIWLFDSACVLCSAAVRYTLRHERAATIRFVAIRSAEGREIAQRHGIDAENPDTFLFVENGIAHGRSDGVMALAHHLDGPAKLVRFGRFMPRSVRDWLYDRVALNRYRLLGRTDQCLVPTSKQRARFVLPHESGSITGANSA